MQAVQIKAYGGGDGLALSAVGQPRPQPGEALVELEFSGVNYIDIYMREGHYRASKTYGSPLPFTLGMEGAGRVADANGAPGLAAGDRVAYCLARGSYAEYAVVPAWKLVKIPDALDAPVATALMLQGCTAHYLSHSLFPLQPGHWCLIHAAAGGVGQLLVQLAKLRGANAIATVGSAEKAQRVTELGADYTVLYRETGFLAAVQDITGGEGVHVVYDSVGADTIADSIRCLRRRGTCVNYGGSSGLVEAVNPLALAEAGSVFFTRPHLAHYMHDAEEIGTRAKALFNAVERNALRICIDRVFPLPDAAQAHAVMENRATRGKLLLAI